MNLHTDPYGTQWADLPDGRLIVLLREPDGWSVSVQPADDLHQGEPFARGLSRGMAQWRVFKELARWQHRN